MTDIPLIEGHIRHAQIILASFNENGLLNLVHVASDGWEALDFLLSPKMLELRRGRQPALILLALGIQVVAAPELLQIIKADSRTNGSPTVILASTLFADATCRAITCRAEGFVEKTAHVSQGAPDGESRWRFTIVRPARQACRRSYIPSAPSFPAIRQQDGKVQENWHAK